MIAESAFRVSILGYVGGSVAVVGPALAVAIFRRNVNASNATLALALTPCVIAVATSALMGEAHEDVTARLWPGLAGTAGLLLLLPQPVVRDWQFGLALAAMPLLAGLGATLYFVSRTSEQAGHFSSVVIYRPAISLAFAGFAYGALALRGLGQGAVPFSWGVAGADGLLALLTVMTLERLGPTRWAAQFLLAPLLTLVEGVAFLRPLLDLRSWLAFGLLTISATYLLVVGKVASPNRASFSRSCGRDVPDA